MLRLRRRRDSRVKRFDEGQAGPFEAGEDRFMAARPNAPAWSMDSMRSHMPCMAYSLSCRALASVVFPALDGPLSRITCPMFSHVALASPGRAAVFGTAGGEVRGRGSSGVIRLAGVAPVQMDIAGAHIPGGDAGIGVPGCCAYGVQRRVAAGALSMSDQWNSWSRKTSPRARTERPLTWLPPR